MMTSGNKWEIKRYSKYQKKMMSGVIPLGLFCLMVAIYPSRSGAADANSFLKNNSRYIMNIQYSDFAISDIRAESASLIPLKIELPQALQSGQGQKTWLRVLGLPEQLKLSKGAQVNQVWFIPSQDTTDLSIKLPKGYTGSFELNFFLMRGEENVVSIMGKKKVNITIISGNNNQSSKQDSASLPQTQDPPAKLTEKEEAILLQRADQLMKLGTFAPARLIYEELAIRGSATAAENLAGTYDPSVIQNSPISGMEPNIQEARKWYEHARKLRNQALN